MIEKPVKRPMVPPTRLIWASNFTFLSRSMSSNVDESKKTWTSSKVDAGSSSPKGHHSYYFEKCNAILTKWHHICGGVELEMSYEVCPGLFIFVHNPNQLFPVQLHTFIPFPMQYSSCASFINLNVEPLFSRLNISIDPFTGHRAVETLACFSLNAIPPFWTAGLQLLTNWKSPRKLKTYKLLFTWKPDTSQGAQSHVDSNLLVLQSLYSSTMQFLSLNDISRKLLVAVILLTAVIQ